MSILTVTQLNRYISFKIKDDKLLKGLIVTGEISGFTNHTRTGHFYFILKDEETQIKAVMFSSFASRLGFMPRNGMKAIVMGSVQVFERDGVYQMYVTDIQPDGTGAMYLAVEELKRKLSSEGLFDAAHKKPIPPVPSVIGVVTARDGAALQDIINVIGRRCPCVKVVVYSCLVQGAQAAQSVCDALRAADKGGCDVIICGRGGGSPEDLMAFNSESIARTVYAMDTPVISAVGHETDTTVIDFVSDLRAPTPSAAAELAVPELDTLKKALDSLAESLDSAAAVYMTKRRTYIRTLSEKLTAIYPAAKLAVFTEHLSSGKAALDNAMKAYIDKKSSALDDRKKQLISSSENIISCGRQRLITQAAALEGLSPLRVLSRGYSIVYNENTAVKSSSEIHKGDTVRLVFSDGSADAVIERIHRP